MTYRHGLTLALALVTAPPVLAQSPTATAALRYEVGVGISPFFMPFLDESGSFPPSGWVTVPTGRFRLQLDYLRDVRSQSLYYAGYYDTDEQGRDFSLRPCSHGPPRRPSIRRGGPLAVPEGQHDDLPADRRRVPAHSGPVVCCGRGTGTSRTVGLPRGVRLLPRPGRREHSRAGSALRGRDRQRLRVSVLHPGAVPGAVGPVARRAGAAGGQPELCDGPRVRRPAWV